MTTNPPYKPPTPQVFPWFMVTHGKSDAKRKTSFYSMLEERNYITSVPYLVDSNKSIRCCCNEWVMICDHSSSPQPLLLNLISADIVNLPALEFKPEDGYTVCSCVLTAPPTDPDCLVGIFSRKSPNVLIWQPDQQTWTEQVYGSRVLHDVAVCNGRVYCTIFWDGESEVGVCERVDKKLVVRSLAPTPALAHNTIFWQLFFVGCQDDLFSVHVCYMGGFRMIQNVEVFKFDEINSGWIRVDDIGDNAFFISAGRQSFCCSTQTNSALKGNCIYFANLFNCHDRYETEYVRDIYVYDLEADGVRTFIPCPHAVNCRSGPCFIMVNP